MDADLTIDAIVYKKNWDDPDKGSQRSSNARGLNTPDILTVRGQDYTDSKTSVSGRRITVRFERHMIDSATATPYIAAMHLVMSVPSLSTTTDMTELKEAIAGFISGGFVTNVLNGEL